ncbi:HAMP domain-containing sensor histidine kinase [Antribacter gilvus]|uniref:HAMP domain-containing sensor histidine kinase n=1 Tax=Antribacter gilvus TaxID=2304675 RepID=UPI000F79A777|nr:ATP-binding protein [Antribacter gilvus]
MLRRLGVRGKILATLATPVLVLVMLAVYIVGESVLVARTAAQTATIVEALKYQDEAGTAFAQERALAIAARAGSEEALAMLTQGIPELDDEGNPTGKMLPSAQDQTNAAIEARDDAFRGMDVSGLDPLVGESVEATMADADKRDRLQELAANRQLTEGAIAKEYSAYIEGALNVARQLSDTSDDRKLALRLDAFITLEEAMLTNTLERPFATIYITKMMQGATAENGGISTSDITNLATLANTLNLQVEQAQRFMDRLDYGFNVAPLTGDYLTGHTAFAESAAAPNSVWFPGFRAGSDQWIIENREVRDELREDAFAWAQAEADLASQRALATAVGALVVVVISVMTALVIARGLVSPLRRLTEAAGDVRDRLPTLVEQVSVPGQGPSLDLEPIAIESFDEVGQLAAAFNDVNRTTIEVAREQAALRGSIAEMFVNVARRDQVLLNRQLAFLDDLERSEEDATTLSNLFRLDHLATRMRRNAESLLVLAGIDSGRRVRQPMPVSDVIRTASSEIELYDRVRLNLVVDPMMLGHNALNAAHLLAELLENATMFSEPHTPVEVITARDDYGVTIAVRDHGLGMTPDEIAEATRKVASHSASDAVGAQRLGLFVVGRLADRLGARVDFGPGIDGSGTQVSVHFPAVLFVPDSAVPLPQPTDPLEATTQAAASRYGSSPVPASLPGSSPVATITASSTTTMPMQSSGQPLAGGSMRTPISPYATSATPMVAPEPPVAVPVDLDALTDGTTALGMPRRRPSRGPETSATPSQSGPMQTATGSIVLPPLVTPDLQSDPGEDTWSPPAQVSPAPASLPSRSRSASPQESVAPLFEDTTPVAPVLDVDQRSALFSSFRSLNTIAVDESPQSLQLDPVTQDPGSLPGAGPDTDVMRFPSGGDQPRAQQQGGGYSQPPQGYPRAQESYVRPQDGYGAGAQGFSPQSSGFGSEGRPDEDVPDDLRFEALPAFEELMENLPTRRSVRESTKTGSIPKRGVFGRKPNGQPLTGELQAYRPTEPTPVSQPVPAVELPTVSYPQADGRPATGYQQQVRPPAATQAQHQVQQPAQPALAFQSAPAPQPAATGISDPVYQQGFHEGYQKALVEAQRQPSSSPYTSAVPVAEPAMSPLPVAEPVQDAYSFVPAQPQEPQPFAPAPAPVPARYSSPVTEIVPIAPQPTAPLPTGPAPDRTVAAQQPDVYREPYPTGAVYDPGYAEPAPLTRRAPAEESLDPLDPGYIRDSVEARSEWMASAVLYEEMTSLLRRGAYQEDDVVPENDTYRPASLTPEVSAGLTRRTRGASGTGVSESVDRLSARIERDPEQLRARLSAFQSATVRGRTEAQDGPGTEHESGNQDGGASTWAPSTMNHVPDSAPQSR